MLILIAFILYPYHSISELQGAGDTSPYVGDTVTTSGIVTGLTGNNFYLQDMSGELRSGIYVYRGGRNTPDIHVGDSIVITGLVKEFANLTELWVSNELFTINIIARNHSLPSPHKLTIPAIHSNGEDYEGMLVRIDSVRFVESGTFQGNTTYHVEDNEGNQLPVWISRYNDSMVGATIPDGYINIVSPLTQYYESYQIEPRSLADFTPAVVGPGVVRLNPHVVFKNERLTLRFDIVTSDTIEKLEITIPEGWTWHSLEYTIYPMQPVLGEVTPSHLYLDSLTVMDSLRVYLHDMEPYEVGEHQFEVKTAPPGGMLVTVPTIPVINVIDSLPIIPISEVQQPDTSGYDSQLLGQLVTVRGVITSPPLGGGQFFIQDTTTGVAIYGFDYNPQMGDEIIVRGKVQEYNGMTELTYVGDECFILLRTDTNATVIPETLKLSYPITEQFEGKLLCIPQAKLHTKFTPGLGAGNFEVWNGNIIINVRVDEGTGIDTSEIYRSLEIGDYITIVGIGSQYDRDPPYNSGYQLKLRYPEDIQKIYIGEPQPNVSIDISPNPFAPELGEILFIKINGPLDAVYTARIFNLRGDLIRTVVERKYKSPIYTDWDGKNELEESVPIGTYILEVEVEIDGEHQKFYKPIVVGTPLK